MLGLNEQQNIIHGQHAYQVIVSVGDHKAEYLFLLGYTGRFKAPDCFGDRVAGGQGVKLGLHYVAGNHSFDNPLNSSFSLFEIAKAGLIVNVDFTQVSGFKLIFKLAAAELLPVKEFL
jgi:hypothetical protein